MTHTRSAPLIIQYALMGIALGCFFPLSAGLLDLFLHQADFSIKTMLQLQQHNPTYWIADSIPLLLGLVGGWIGKQTSARSATRQQQQQSLERQNRALVKLVQNHQLSRGDLWAILKEITETATETLEVERVTVWLYSDDRHRMSCLDAYDRTTRHHTTGMEISKVESPVYFQALDSDGCLIVSDGDPDDDPSIEALRVSYLRPRNITALLDVPVRLDDRVLGRVRYEHTGTPRQWKPQEQTFAVSLADLVAVAMQADQFAAQNQRERTSAEVARWESEERFRWLSEATFEGIVIHTQNVIVDTNQALAKMLGYDAEELVGMSPLDLIEEPWREAALQSLLSGPETIFESVGLRKNGSALAIEIQSRLLPYKGREVRVAAVRDMTERLAAQKALRQSEARYRAISELASDYIYSTEVKPNQEMVFEWVTQSFERITGYTLEEVKARGGWSRVVYPEDLLKAKRFDSDGAFLGAGMLEYRIINKRGEVRWLRDYARPEWDSNKQRVLRLLGAVQDITAAKQGEAQLYRAKEAAEAANRAKSAFLANISHELRTPLHAILGYSEILLEEAQELDNAASVTDLEKIRSAGNYLLTLINHILDISKIEAGKMDLYVEVFDLPTLIEEVASTVQPMMDKGNNRFKLIYDADIGLMQADLTKVRQVLLNLLSNAAKFTHRGQVTLEVTRQPWVGTEGDSKAQEQILFKVTDTGIGISPEQMSHLFEPFVQGDASTTRKYGGTGLGLAIGQRFCQLMGGAIAVESQWGAGSVFTVCLPVEVASLTTKDD